MSLEIKKDPWVIGSYTVLTLAAIALMGFKVIDVKGFLLIIGALNAPAVMGMKKDVDDDQPPPSVPTSLIPPAMMLCLVLSGCVHATRAEARGAVLATAEAVKVGDEVCAKRALERTDLELARRCEAAYTTARGALITAAASVDAWDEGKRGDVTCSVVHAIDEVAKVAAELRARKLPVPPVLDDAVRLASALGGCK